MILEIQTLFVIFRSNALQARQVFQQYCRSQDVVLHATIAATSGLLVYLFSNHQRRTKLKRFTRQLFSLREWSWNLKQKSAQSIQAVSRGFLQRQRHRKRNRASVVIQSRIRGITVRSILCGQGLPALARALVQEEDEDGVQQYRAAATQGDVSRGNSSVHEDCKNLIAVFQEEKKAQTNVDSTRDQSPTVFGTQVKAVMEARMRLLAAVVLQSWFRMIRCRLGYQRIFSSLNTAPITNMPSLGTPGKQEKQAEEVISFVSSLSSWSSTWNRIQPSRLAASDSFLLTSRSSFENGAFKATREEEEALKGSINDYASTRASIVQLQAWWRASLVKIKLQGQASQSMEMKLNVLSDSAVSAPQVASAELDDCSISDNTIRASNMSLREPQEADEGRSVPHPLNKVEGTRRRKRRTTKYTCSDLLQNTLERVGEIPAMCNSAINSTEFMECKGAEFAWTICEDPTSYEVVLTGAGKEILTCSARSSMRCGARSSRRHVGGGVCAWVAKDELIKSAATKAMEVAGQIGAWRRPPKKLKRKGGSKSGESREGPPLHNNANRELLDVEPLSSANTNCSTNQLTLNTLPSSPSTVAPTFSSPTSYDPQDAFSSPYSSYTCQTYETDETSHQSSEDMRERSHQKRSRGMNYALCVAPVVPTRYWGIPSSESSNSESSDGVESYYSIDDIDVHDDDDDRDDEERSSQRYTFSAKIRARRPQHRYLDTPVYDDDESIPSCAR